MKWLIYSQDQAGRWYVDMVTAADEAKAKLTWSSIFASATSRAFVVMEQDTGAYNYWAINPLLRAKYLLAQQKTTAPEQGALEFVAPIEPAQPAPEVSLECWRDPIKQPIDPDKAMRELRVLCGGDANKGRKKS